MGFVFKVVFRVMSPSIQLWHPNSAVFEKKFAYENLAY